MKAKIKNILLPDQKTVFNIVITFDIISFKDKIIIENFNCNIDPSIYIKAPNKKQFIFRSINDILKSYNINQINIEDINLESYIKIDDEIILSENEPNAYNFVIPELPTKIKDAQDFLKLINIEQISNIDDLKVVINKLLICIGMR